MANLDDLEFYELVTWQESIDKCYFSTAKTIGDYLVEGPKASCSVIASFPSGAVRSLNTRRTTDIRISSGAILDIYPSLQKCALYFDNGSGPKEISGSTIEEFCEYYNSNYPVFVGAKPVKVAIRENNNNHFLDLYLEGLSLDSSYHSYIPEDVEVGAFRISANNTIGNDSSYTGIKSMGLAANVPIFENYTDANNYISGMDGAIEKAINYGGTETDVNPTNKIHTWRQVLHRVNANGSNDTIVGYKNVVVTTTSVGRVAAYYSDFNILLNVKNKASGVISITYNEDGVEHTYTNIEDINDKLTWTEQNCNFIKEGNYYYWSRVIKYNWPISGNVDDAEAYIDRSIDSDDEKPTKINPTGTEKENQTDDLNNNTSSNTLSRLYVMDKSSMYDVADALYDTNTGSGSIVDTIKKGLQLYNNPMEFIIDIYYTPIDVNDFINYTTVGHVQLGAYYCNVDGRCQYVGYNGNLKQLFSTFIYEDYYDFRDYQTDYYLYLPFIGIFQLPTSQVIGRLVTVKVAYDLRSHNMKYYIFSDGKLILTKEGSLGIQFPITYSDQVGKANQNITALSSLANNTLSLPSSVATGNMQGALSSMTDIFNSTIALYDRAKIGTSGNASSAAAAYDILYPYLIIDRPEYIKPSNLESQYNLPCNRIDKLSTSKGWTVCDDVKLEIDCLPEEKDMIENMLRSGVKF